MGKMFDLLKPKSCLSRLEDIVRHATKSTHYLQKQSPIGGLNKRCDENMEQIYRRAPMPKCDFNKVV